MVVLTEEELREEGCNENVIEQYKKLIVPFDGLGRQIYGGKPYNKEEWEKELEEFAEKIEKLKN